MMNCKCTDCKCSTPPEACLESIKKLNKFLEDTKRFLKLCEVCPVAQKLIETADELIVTVSKIKE